MKLILQGLMNLLVSERDAFANRIYLYVVNFVGKGIVYLECLGEKLDFYSIFKKAQMKYVTLLSMSSVFYMLCFI